MNDAGSRRTHERFMPLTDRFASVVFKSAGIYGILALLPLYLLESGLGPALGPPLQRPEHFYGFVGTALAWQLVFLVIAGDVRRFRPLMLPAVAEKLAFGVPAWILFAQGRVGAAVLVFGSIDLVLAVLFVLSYRATRSATV